MRKMNDKQYVPGEPIIKRELKSSKVPGGVNQKCPFCDSGKKFKKCDCYYAYKEMHTLLERV